MWLRGTIFMHVPRLYLKVFAVIFKQILERRPMWRIITHMLKKNNNGGDMKILF